MIAVIGYVGIPSLFVTDQLNEGVYKEIELKDNFQEPDDQNQPEDTTSFNNVFFARSKQLLLEFLKRDNAMSSNKHNNSIRDNFREWVRKRPKNINYYFIVGIAIISLIATLVTLYTINFIAKFEVSSTVSREQVFKDSYLSLKPNQFYINYSIGERSSANSIGDLGNKSASRLGNVWEWNSISIFYLDRIRDLVDSSISYFNSEIENNCGTLGLSLSQQSDLLYINYSIEERATVNNQNGTGPDKTDGGNNFELSPTSQVKDHLAWNLGNKSTSRLGNVWEWNSISIFYLDRIRDLVDSSISYFNSEIENNCGTLGLSLSQQSNQYINGYLVCFIYDSNNDNLIRDRQYSLNYSIVTDACFEAKNV